MVVDAREPKRNLPIPDEANKVAEEFPRLREALQMLGVDVDGLLTSVAGKAALVHGHDIGAITGLAAALASKLESVPPIALDDLTDVTTAGADNLMVLMRVAGAWQPGVVNWANLGGKPSSFTPSSHSHALTDVTGLEGALAVLVSAIDAKAPLASPQLTGMVRINKTAAAEAYIDIETDTSTAPVQMTRRGGAAWARHQRSDGTAVSPTALSNAAVIGGSMYIGWDGAAWLSAARMAAYVDGTPSAGFIPAGFEWWTRNQANAYARRMNLTPDGQLQVLGRTISEDATPTAAGILPAADKAIIDQGSRGHYGSTSSFTLGAAHLGKSITCASNDQTLTVPTVASLGGALGLTFGPIKVTGPILATLAASGADTLRFFGGWTPASIVLGLGQEVMLRSTGPTTWTIFGHRNRVPLLDTAMSALSTLTMTLPPGYRKFNITGRIKLATAYDILCAQLSADLGSTWISSASAYSLDYFTKSAGNSVTTNWDGTKTRMEVTPQLAANGDQWFRAELLDPHDLSVFTTLRSETVGAVGAAGGGPVAVSHMGTWRALAEDNNAIKFFTALGSVMNGHICVEGVV